MTDTIWGATKKPVTSQRLAKQIEAAFPEEGVLYVGYPVLSTSEGANSIDALWVSPSHGLVIFHLIEGRDITGFEDVQDEYANNLETRLRPHKSLMRGRTLLAAPAVVTYAPMVQIISDDENYPVANDKNLISILRAIAWDNPNLYPVVHSVIQSISTIRKGRRRRHVLNQDSHGARLKNLEDSIANLDSLQSRAVIETVEGVQRIRGLAGSGKTIVLALKAAYLHVQHPEWKIAVTFNTRSLKAQFHRLIETFVVDQTGEGPFWENIQIINAWGAPGGVNRTGIYYQFCQQNGLEFHDFGSAKEKFSLESAFSGVVDIAINSVSEGRKIFDTILVDEAQDFHPNFLRLCYMCLGDVKRLVYAYDELQSLTESSLPPPEALFGVTASGRPNVSFVKAQPGRPNQDIILEKCYRNSRPVLATAHALGFGVYRDPDPKSGTGLIQMFDRAELWKDVGYTVKSGTLQDGEEVTLARTPESSPEFLEELASDVDTIIEFICFKNHEHQAKWLAKNIEKNLREDELHYDDIIVINPDPITTIKQAGMPRKILFEMGIQSHVAGVDTASDVFFKTDEESIAFTGIFRAKGNEAGMVYVMNAHDCYASGNIGKVRNQLFTAITRSKAWVKVLGVGPMMTRLKDEFERVQSHDYELNFVYPTAAVRKKLKLINRDLSPEEERKIKGAVTNISTLIEDITAGKVLLEDLPKKDIEKLRRLLSKGS